MTESKTKPTDASVDAFIDALPDEGKRADAQALAALMTRLTGDIPAMWGGSIIGFGSYRYRYDSGRTGEICRIGFSPRKAELVLYGIEPSEEREILLARLGKHRTGKGCIYIRRLTDIDASVLENLIRAELARADTAAPR